MCTVSMCAGMCVWRECPRRIKATGTGFHIKDERHRVVLVFSHAGSDSDLSLYLKNRKNFEQSPNIFFFFWKTAGVFFSLLFNSYMRSHTVCVPVSDLKRWRDIASYLNCFLAWLDLLDLILFTPLRGVWRSPELPISFFLGWIYTNSDAATKPSVFLQWLYSRGRSHS